MTDYKPLSEMSDDEVANISPEDYAAVMATEEAQANESVSPEESGETEDQSAGEPTDEENHGVDAGGAADDEGSFDEASAGADTTSTEDEGEAEDADPTSVASDEASGDDQSQDQGESGDAESSQDESATDYQVEYEKLMAPFKAAKRMVSLDNVDDARRLLQMGVDYSQKMADIKPHMRVLRTLEKADLLDPSRINFLIDLDKKNPEAIKKLLKEADIDPMSVDLEGSEAYSSPDRMISDAELNVRDVLDNIQYSPKFQETVEVITKVMDTKSRQALQDSPEVIATLHDHIEAGVYHKVQDQVANEKMLGRLTGLSDLEAYYRVGDAMHKAGAFKQPGDAPPTTEDGSQDSAQESGSGASKEASLRDRRRAAKPTKGKGSKGGKPSQPDLSKMDDKQFEEYMATLS
jgi:hypothetical protein